MNAASLPQAEDTLLTRAFDVTSHLPARDRLRMALNSMREKAKLLASEVATDLPELTVHDISHSDRLWDLVTLIAGPTYPLTPTEAFVLGGAFITHDLGMSLAAYPGGLDELRNQPQWEDALLLALKHRYGRDPGPEEIANPPADVTRSVTADVLRDLHAEKATQLVLAPWRHRDDDPEYYLLEDSELRNTYGQLIGQIAASHGDSVANIGSTLDRKVGAPSWGDPEWTLDTLKVACLLRVADATHLDASRAPGFLRAVRRPSSRSTSHWIFQEKLQRPRSEEGRLLFTSPTAFGVEEADAWWLCHDVLQAADRELRDVDALLADTHRDRFAVSGVALVDDPKRLAQAIPTEDWTPVDTRIRVSDVASLVRTLGGGQLYGEDLSVPLRELIQNGADAVKALSILEGRAEAGHGITIRVGTHDADGWLEVEDDGLGMSEAVVTGPLLDFGTSYWRSPMLRADHPGLSAKGFKPTGTYGIGFFSVFMWGGRVQVTTLRHGEALADTRVLEFKSLEQRPLLRVARPEERLPRHGTRVRVWFDEQVASLARLLTRPSATSPWTLTDFCAWLCPALDCDLSVVDDDATTTVIRGSDWKHMSGLDLMVRIAGNRALTHLPFTSDIAENMRLLTDHRGEVRGRAAFFPLTTAVKAMDVGTPGVVTVGGLRAMALSAVAGVIEGTPIRVPRDAALPTLSQEELAVWANGQASILTKVTEDSAALAEIAGRIHGLGASTKELPVVCGCEGWLTYRDFLELIPHHSEIVLAQNDGLASQAWAAGPFRLHPNAVIVGTGYHGLMQVSGPAAHTWPPLGEWYGTRGFPDVTLEGLCLRAMAQAWEVPLECLHEQWAKESGRLREETRASGRPPKLSVGRRADTDVMLTAKVIRRPGPRLAS